MTEDSNSLPIDWNETGGNFRGVSRNERLGGYLAVLLLNKKQVHFGPFKISRLEAATAADRLTKYFLPFVKSKPTPNCSAEVLFGYVDSDTEELYGEERLQRLRQKLTTECEELGFSVAQERAAREDYLKKNCGLHTASAKLVDARDRSRRKALIKLEVLALNNSKTFDFLTLVRELTVPKERMTPELLGVLKSTKEKFDLANSYLVALIRDLKTALDLNPDVSTK